MVNLMMTLLLLSILYQFLRLHLFLVSAVKERNYQEMVWIVLLLSQPGACGDVGRNLIPLLCNL
jgi:hypothetical protein